MQAITLRVKLSVAGLPNVGKTSLIHRQVMNTFGEYRQATIGIDFHRKYYQVGNITAKVNIWDQVGGERYKLLKYSYMKGSQAICLCFSLEERYSFEEVPRFLKDFEALGLRCPIYLIGCKNDLQAALSEEEVSQFAAREGLAYFVCSAREGKGVAEAFRIIVEEAVAAIIKDPSLTAQLTVPSQQPMSRLYCHCHV